jgi:hypothetical protein
MHPQIQERRRLSIAAALLLHCLFAAYEWNVFKNPVFFYPNGFAMPCYTRPSLFFSAFVVLVICTCWPIAANKYAAWFSRRSLGTNGRCGLLTGGNSPVSSCTQHSPDTRRSLRPYSDTLQPLLTRHTAYHSALCSDTV